MEELSMSISEVRNGDYQAVYDDDAQTSKEA